MVEIVEVSPRDGLQNEAATLSTGAKLRLIDGLVAAGLRRIEATSFVHPRLVPQMADAEAVADLLPRGQVSWIGLVLNERGLDRAIAAGMDEVNIVVVASETFSVRNQGTSMPSSNPNNAATRLRLSRTRSENRCDKLPKVIASQIAQIGAWLGVA